MSSRLAFICVVEALGAIWYLGKAIWLTHHLRSALALTVTLQQEFTERVPSGWIFHDGVGR